MRKLSLLILLAPVMAWGTSMNLSSDLPMEFDGKTNCMVARQNATFTQEDLILTADEIRYAKDTKVATATGNARANFKTIRLVAKEITYRTEDGYFDAKDFRLGFFPYLIEGKRVSGTQKRIVIEDAVLRASQTGKAAPTIGIHKLVLQPNDNATKAAISQALFRFSALPLFPIPPLFVSVPNNNLPSIRAEAGSSGNMGYFLRTESLMGVSEHVSVGANLDYYSKRGWLMGPRVEWKAGSFLTEISSAYINDGGERDEDSRGLPIDEDRGFVEAHSKGKVGDVAVTAQLQYWSDSEVLRDFRPDAYAESPSPDTFVEAVWPLDGAYVSAFTRFNPNNFDEITTRLPEVRFDKLSTPIGTSGAYYSFLNSAAVLENDADENVNRIDSLLTVRRPIALKSWWEFTPLASGRATYYSKSDGSNDHVTRTFAEVGFDSTWTFSRVWDTQNPVWKIDGLRHLVQPTLQYRYIPNGDQHDDEILGMDVDSFGTSVLNPMDMWEDTALDDLSERQLLRLGLKQSLQTRQSAKAGFPSRELVSFDVYQDFNLTSPDDTKTIGDFYTIAAIHPASWLEAGAGTRMDWEDLTWKQHNIWVTVRDGDQWSVTTSSRFLQGDTKQYGLRATYRLTDVWSALAEATYDGYRHGWNYLCVGFNQRLRSGWQAFYGLTRREGDDRDSSTRLTLRMNCLQF